jgi:hypothetical protein
MIYQQQKLSMHTEANNKQINKQNKMKTHKAWVASQ